MDRGHTVLRSPGISHGRAVAVLTAVIAAAVAVRLVALYDRSIWFDEASSWRNIGFPLPEMFARIAANIHVPLFYVLLKGWVAALGDSIVALRSFSLFWAAVATLAMYLFAREAYREPEESSEREAEAHWIGLAAAVLFAASPYQVRLAWEIRMYALGTALVLLSSWLLVRALHQPRPTWRAWGLYATVTLAFAWTHHFALLSIAGQALYLAVRLVAQYRLRVRQWAGSALVRRVAAAMAAIAVGWSPWLPVFLAQRRQVESGWWSGPLSYGRILAVTGEMVFGRHAYFASFGWQLAALVGVVLLIYALLWRGRWADLYLALMAAVPFFLALYASLGNSSVMVARYFAFAQPFVLVAAAALLAEIPGRSLRTAIAGVLASLLVAVHLDFVETSGVRDAPGMRAAAQYLAAHRHPSDPVIASSPYLYYPLLYYTKQPARCHVFSSTGSLNHHRGGPFARPGEVIDRPHVAAIGPGKVWVVTSSSPWAQGEYFLPHQWRLESESRFGDWLPHQRDVIVAQYTVPPR